MEMGATTSDMVRYATSDSTELTIMMNRNEHGGGGGPTNDLPVSRKVIKEIKMDFQRTKKYFVGIDSDGTVFDSMTVKHRDAFIPQMIEVWNLHNVADVVEETAVHLNLYSKDRGIDRFKGLVKTFDILKDRLGEAFVIDDYSSLRDYTLSDFPMSNTGLKDYMKTDGSEFLNDVLRWSEVADEVFSKKMKTMPLFAHCKDTIERLSQYADIAVVSSASYQSLMEDWTRTGLIDYVTLVGGQEIGSKVKQLEYALKKGYSPEECLVIGDAPGDKKAADKWGMKFYLIEPGSEEESWKKLGDDLFSVL